jgi:D-serine deaminase-like pyridoxal phosphate-dependent protein
MERSSVQWDVCQDEGVGEQRTPRLVLDAARLEANLARGAAAARARNATLRPHIKTHKSAAVLRRQIAAGLRGVTTATIREAELAIACGVDDVLIAYPPVPAWRLRALDALLDRARLIVACSERAHVEALATLERPIDYYWELDSGTGRLGTEPGEPTAALLDDVCALEGPRLAGLMTFAGHAYGDGDGDAAERESAALLQTATALRARGIAPGELSTGCTPLLDREVAGATEYRFGNYAFYDATQVALGAAHLDDCALTVEATVVARPAADRVILDAGSKALAAERMSGATTAFGLVRDHPELTVAQLYEEHAICRVDGACELALGDRVAVIPNHACTCANLHAEYTVRFADGSEERWPIDARGWEDGR